MLIYLTERQKRFVFIAIMTFFVSIIVFVICFTTLSALYADTDCVVDIGDDFTFQHPLILDPNNNLFVNLNNRYKLQIPANSKLHLACPGSSNSLEINNAKEADITCISGTSFFLGSSIVSFGDLKCKNYPTPAARKTGKKCSSKYTEIEIGFSVTKGFVPIMINCLDESTSDSLYSYYYQTPQIRYQQVAVPRPNDFIEGDFYPDLYPQPSTIYGRNSQRTAFTRILGSSELAEKYISTTTDYYLSRGHLTAKADFVYGSQQRATFFYVNVAPQWQIVNKNNWNSLEISVRNFAFNRNLNLVVYTGTYGSAKLNDINGIPRELSIYVDRNNNKALTVPDIFWKVLHDPIAKTGIVFVTHNNPYETNVTPLCTNVCSKINWVSWKPTIIEQGFSYCCDFEEFKRIVDYVPDIEINNLLT